MSAKKSIFIIDAPGITGMGANALQKMVLHAQAGGDFVHEVNSAGVLRHPEKMWPGRGLAGQKVRLDGTVVAN